MKNQLKEIKEKVARMQSFLIDDDNTSLEDDSLLDDYTKKYDKFVSQELSFYYELL